MLIWRDKQTSRKQKELYSSASQTICGEEHIFCRLRAISDPTELTSSHFVPQKSTQKLDNTPTGIYLIQQKKSNNHLDIMTMANCPIIFQLVIFYLWSYHVVNL